MTASLTVCFVTANTFEYDSRTQRAAEALAADGHRVVVVALAGPGLPDASDLPGGIRIVRPVLDRRIASAFRPLPAPLRAGLARTLGFAPGATVLPARGPGWVERVRGPFRRASEILAYRRRVGPWAAAAAAAAPDADVFSAKALVALPVVRVAAARTGGRFVYDIADLHVESGRLARLPRPLKAYLHRRERAWMAEAAGLTAVTAPLAEEVVRRYGVPRPIVVLNARPRWRPEEPTLPQTVRLRDAAGVPADRAILLYQGAFREDQGIEELLPALDSASLRDRPLTTVFLGFGRLETRLREAMARAPERIVVLPAVPSGELLEWTSGADLAFVGAPPRTVNLRLTIPNKLFESLMAGVPVVVAGGTAVARLVAQTDVGVVVDPWSSGALAAALAGVLDAPAADRAAARARARAAALERLNWETERDGLLGMYRRLAGG
jgi:glycosyltransferase involved in cell wall biosynthesis